jgi:hypothetical protein
LVLPTVAKLFRTEPRHAEGDQTAQALGGEQLEVQRNDSNDASDDRKLDDIAGPDEMDNGGSPTMDRRLSREWGMWHNVWSACNASDFNPPILLSPALWLSHLVQQLLISSRRL